jgi:hypothetical protein
MRKQTEGAVVRTTATTVCCHIDMQLVLSPEANSGTVKAETADSSSSNSNVHSRN